MVKTDLENKQIPIKIKKSEIADTRTCDYTKVTKGQLLDASLQHIEDVKKGLGFFRQQLIVTGMYHDFDKISDTEGFHRDFLTGFKSTEWWDNHRRVNRHHISSEDGIPDNFNLVDVLEYITDCVMAGVARSGRVSSVELDSELLQRAFKNTVEWLISNVELEEKTQSED